MEKGINNNISDLSVIAPINHFIKVVIKHASYAVIKHGLLD